jgi:hypothetical protein
MVICLPDGDGEGKRTDPMTVSGDGDGDGKRTDPMTVSGDGDGEIFHARRWLWLSNNQWLVSPLPYGGTGACLLGKNERDEIVVISSH